MEIILSDIEHLKISQYGHNAYEVEYLIRLNSDHSIRGYLTVTTDNYEDILHKIKQDLNTDITMETRREVVNRHGKRTDKK